jgi:hypothetical protein
MLRMATNKGGIAILTYFDEDDASPTFNRFVYIRTVSSGVNSPTPGPHFVQQVLRRATDSSGNDWIYMFGTGTSGGHDYFLARTPTASFGTTNDQTEYLTAVSGGNPCFSPASDEATTALFGLLNQAVERSPGFQKLGVRGCSVAQFRLGWLMIHEAEAEQGQLLFRRAENPWGPWSPPQPIYNTTAGLDPSFGGNGAGSGAGIMHLSPPPQGQPDDGLDGPNTHNVPVTAQSGQQESYLAYDSGRPYYPRIIESWTRYTPPQPGSGGFPSRPGSLSIYFTISTWEPYYMQLMRADFTVGTTVGNPCARCQGLTGCGAALCNCLCAGGMPEPCVHAPCGFCCT